MQCCMVFVYILGGGGRGDNLKVSCVLSKSDYESCSAVWYMCIRVCVRERETQNLEVSCVLFKSGLREFFIFTSSQLQQKVDK